MEPTLAPEPSPEFPWQAFFQRSRDPLFLLNRQRRILFVNHAWEHLTGQNLTDVWGWVCTRRKPAIPSAINAVTRLLYPPAEVLQGRSAQVRRFHPQTGMGWDITFIPFQNGDRILGILGRIKTVLASPAGQEPLPARLQALRYARTQRFRLETLQSKIPAVQRAVEQARMAANVTAVVLIVGEAGTGKQWLARAIHQLGPRHEEPFVVIDCGKLPAEALEKVLFGDRGLMSGGRAGTVYLRDPGTLPRDLQARFVDILSEMPPRTPRVIAGSSSDLSSEARSLRVLDEFRCRLSTLLIELLPLRERLADFPILVELFLDQACQRTPGSRERPTLTPEASDLLRGYSWPGNLDELAAVLAGARERTTDKISPAELPAILRLAGQSGSKPSKPDQPLPLSTILEEAERRLIQLALQRTNGNKTKAAELLGLWKPRLLRRMAALGLKDS